MADSSYEKGLTELTKMKVADLKVELKSRGLPTTGNKNELVERLQLAMHGDSTLSLDETVDEILDEDAVLEDEEIEDLQQNNKTHSPEMNGKRKLSTDNASLASNKKIVLNRTPVVEPSVLDTVKATSEEDSDEKQPEKKIIKLSDLGVKERLEMRAKKFGVTLSDTVKKEARSARFNSNNSGSSAIAKTSVASFDVLKKRAERFGSSVSSVMEKAELAEKIEKRRARFGEVKPEPKFNRKIKIVK